MKTLACRTRSVRRLFRCTARSTALLCCLGLPASLALPAPLDKADAAVKGATVYLKDGHTLSVKSYVADDGTYRFGQLAQNTDYELWAEFNGKKSSVKNLSSFDTRSTFNIILKIDTAKIDTAK